MSLPDTLRIIVHAGAEGTCRIELEVEEMHLNVERMLHGGVVSTMLDMAIARAIRSVVPDDIEIMTSSLNVNFFGSVKSGHIVAYGRTVFRGNRLIHGEAELKAGERMLARATGTWYTRPRRPAAPPAA